MLGGLGHSEQVNFAPVVGNVSPSNGKNRYNQKGVFIGTREIYI